MGDRRRTANGKQNLPRAHDYVIGSFHIRMSARALTWVGSPTDCLLERLLWVIVPRMLGCTSIYQRDRKPPGVSPPRGNEIVYLRGQIVADPGLFLIWLYVIKARAQHGRRYIYTSMRAARMATLSPVHSPCPQGLSSSPPSHACAAGRRSLPAYPSQRTSTSSCDGAAAPRCGKRSRCTCDTSLRGPRAPISTNLRRH